MEADYVIVGAGSAGCALAARLSEDGRHQVLVIEAGGSDRGPFIQMPAALSYPMNMRRYDWRYRTEPEPFLAGRRLAAPRGRVIGGSSSINGMVYVRGHALDYDHWAESGARGWSFAEVLPYFRRLECCPEGETGWRGTDGPLHITRGRLANPLYHAFLAAGRQAGYGITDDYNGARQEGFGALEMTVRDGRRWSAASAYLKPARQRQNLSLLRARARRVRIEAGRATGVEVEAGGRRQTVRARCEVVLAASAFNTPQLLLLSGVGPAAELAAMGIRPVADRPGVGGNLQDHLEVYVQHACRQKITLNRHLGLLSRARIGARWLLFGDGLGASNHFEAGGFIRSAAGVAYPDIQFHFLPAAIRYDGRAAEGGDGFQVHAGPMRAASRGRVTLRSPDPDDPPRIRFNYLSCAADRRDFRTCLRLTREILRQPALAPLAGRELAPGPEVTDDAALDAFVAAEAESAYHPCGTCRMGDPEDPATVVDPDCRVVGVERLRVADSSVFPRIPNGNLNGPSIMVGEKASDHILGRDRLPPENSVPWVHPDWRRCQREQPPGARTSDSGGRD